MTASASHDKQADLMENGPPAPARRSRGRVLLATACAVAVAVAGGAGVWLAQDSGDASPNPPWVGMSGEMTMGDYRSRVVDVGSRYEENRDATGRGSIELHLPGQDLVGDVSSEFAASLLSAPDGSAPAVVHSWGTITAAFGGNVCRGSFSFSHFERPAEGGGSMQLTCDDESAFAATTVVTQTGDTFVFELSDGWYVPPNGA